MPRSPYDVPLPSPVDALIAFYEGVDARSDEQRTTLLCLYALARVEAACDYLDAYGARLQSGDEFEQGKGAAGFFAAGLVRKAMRGGRGER